MTLSLNSALWLLVAVVAIVGVIGVVNAVREKLREFDRPADRTDGPNHPIEHPASRPA